MVIPVLDPNGEDRKAFVKWAIRDVFNGSASDAVIEKMSQITEGYSAASFASLRSDLRAEGVPLSIEQILEIASDRILPDIGPVRRYQTLQALINCTRKSLLPEDYSHQMRAEWMAEVRRLEQMGVGR
jgi:hypothetical protein